VKAGWARVLARLAVSQSGALQIAVASADALITGL
jgi:hypothetical protein